MDYLNELKVNPHNPSKIDAKKIKEIKKSLQAFTKMLRLRPIVYNDENIILGGNKRFLALKELNIPIEDEFFKHAKDFSHDEQMQFVIKDNVLVHDEWDREMLQEYWSDYPLEDWGVPREDWEIKKEIQEDEAPEVSQEPPISKLGEVYQLGRHRLMCGDSTKIEDVEKLMNGQKADMVFTDPPYGMKKENEGVLNDNLNYDDLLEFNKEWIPLSFLALKDNGSWYCWGIDEPLMDIYSNIIKPYIKENKATFRNLITWNKGNGQGQNSDEYRMYAIADEKCLFIMMGVQGFNTNADNYYEAWESIRVYLENEIKAVGKSDQQIAEEMGYKDGRTVNHWWSKSQWSLPTEENYDTLRRLYGGFKKDYEEIKKDYEEIKKDYEEIKKDYYATRAYFNNTHDNMNNVWHFNRDISNQDHATPKPIELCSRAIKSSSRENEIVLDLFGGSGSTLIACEQLDRTCYMMELDPKYCDVIRKRYAKFIGKEGEWQKIT